MEAWKTGEAEIYTINWESLPRFVLQCLKGWKTKDLPVDTVIFDELTQAKNHNSKRVHAFKAQRFKFKRFWGLTGTPIPNGQLDLFAQIRLLDEGKRLGKSFTHFQQNLFDVINPRADHPKFKLKEEHKVTIEKKLADIALTLRSEDWLKIPPTETIDIPVALPKEARGLYKELEKELLLLLEEDFEVAAVNAGVLITKLVQVTSGAIYETPPPGEDGRPLPKRVKVLHNAKLKALEALYHSEGRKPFLVATRYRHEASRILESVPGAEAFEEGNLDRWNRGEIPYWVAHPKSIGHGLNLQHGGCRAVWFSMDHNRELYDQFNARVARQGQKEETRIFRLLCPGSIDDAIADAVEFKGDNQSEFMATLRNLQALRAK
jgi:SNF2 family DNA or RNA helicase